MEIVQDAFEIPADIKKGLATGEFIRYGSLIRYGKGPNKGRIVTHLKSIGWNDTENAQGIGDKVLLFLKQHKKGAILVFVGAAGAVGAWICNKMKYHEPKAVKEFKAALETYAEAIDKGEMDVEKINALMIALEELKMHKDEKISIQLKPEDLEVLVNTIYEYTIELAKKNSVELTEDEMDISKKANKDAIINLQTYLEVQKRIFETAA